eukprot:4637422-Alexandrium_andersonii.AAC.1
MSAHTGGSALPRKCQLNSCEPSKGVPSLMPWRRMISRGDMQRQPTCSPSRKRATSCPCQGSW